MTSPRSFTWWDLSRSLISLPIFRVGVSADIAYCGTRETSVIRRGRMALLSAIGSSLPSTVTLPPVAFIRASR